MLILDKETLLTIIKALDEQYWSTKNRQYLELAERLEKRIELLDKLGDE